MKRLHHPRPVRHGLLDLPLFAWASAIESPSLTTGGRWLCRRHRVPRELANIVAELAGIGGERLR
jgi:hypothetical protein